MKPVKEMSLEDLKAIRKANGHLTLSQCARWDYLTGARKRLTGWGVICRNRHRKG